METSATPHSVFVSIKRNNLQVSSIEAGSHDLRIKKMRRVVVNKSNMIKRRKNGGTLIKRSRVIRSKPTDEIEWRVRKLKKLIPSNGSDESTAGLDGLFRDTADYIVSLQMRVRCMQMMVNALTTQGSN